MRIQLRTPFGGTVRLNEPSSPVVVAASQLGHWLTENETLIRLSMYSCEIQGF